MTKKIIKIVSTLLLFSYLSATIIAQDNLIKKPPNIIFILTDDQRWDALGYAGNNIIQTPNMDKLATQGVYFDNAFVTTPICAASRASIMTGLYERKHKFTFGTDPLSKNFINISYPKLLKENGYRTGFIGKFGMQFEDKIDTTLFNYISRPGEQFWATTYHRLTSDHTKHQHLTDKIGELSVDFIKNAATKNPFCLSISFHAPHAEDVDPRQYIYPLDLDSLYEKVQIPEPQLIEDRYFDAQPQWVKDGLNKIRWYWRFDSPQKYQQMVKGYYRMISGVDREIGKIRDLLKDLDIEDNTILIFMGDNGYFLGERKLAGKWLMYENSLRVPLIIYDPRNSTNQTINKNVLNIDIAPTILKYAGIEIPSEMQGEYLQSLMSKNDIEWRKSFLCEHLMESKKIPKSEGIRTEKFKYFRYIDHPEHQELYDLSKDPLEQINLAKNPDYAKTLTELSIQCDKLIYQNK